MDSKLKIGTSALLCALGLSLGQAANAAVSYGDYIGTTVTFADVVEASGDPIEDPEPLYGAPTVSGDTLDFNPTAGFAADAPPTDTTDGALTFTLESNTASPIAETMVISESGTFEFTGVGAGELVVARLLVQVFDLTGTLLATDQQFYLNSYTGSAGETGTWSLTSSIDLTPFDATAVNVVVNNVLQTTGIGPAEVIIAKTDFDIDVPEPASAALLGGLGLLALRRRSA
ncbi:MAG: PEP-CTERM sorting domain-containing protein [Planctomycetota bacterium]